MFISHEKVKYMYFPYKITGGFIASMPFVAHYFIYPMLSNTTNQNLNHVWWFLPLGLSIIGLSYFGEYLGTKKYYQSLKNKYQKIIEKNQNDGTLERIIKNEFSDFYHS